MGCFFATSLPLQIRGVCIADETLATLVGNYYSDGTLERLALHLGLLKDYLRFLAGDPSHSRSVSQSVHLLYFLGFRFDLIYFLGVSCCCIR